MTVSGKVTTSNGQVLPGVNIKVAGTTTGTSTDVNGKYKLTVPSLQDTLVFSYIGYQTQTIPINGRQTINISMKSSIIGGQQLVVVGYGTEQQQNVTSAIATVGDSAFNKGQVSNPAELIQGKVAGLQISKPGSNPNGGYTIRLRGLSTLGANSEPLIIVNGVPGASLNNVDPNDIKSINVLKSASASAIYGTRGSNGVIIVKTKSGQTTSKKPQFHVEYKGSGTINEPFRKVQVLSADQYRKFLKFYGDKTGQDLSGSDLGSSTNWYDEITRTGYDQTHYLALSGGSRNTNYRISLNYRNQKGILKNTGFDKIDARVNLNQTALDDKLELNLNLAANRAKRKYGFADAFRYATIYNPTAPVRSDDPKFDEYGGYFQQKLFDYYNPVSIVEQDQHNGNGSHLNGSLKGTYTFADYIPGLSVSAFYSERSDKLSRGQYFPSTEMWQSAVTRKGIAYRREDNNSARLIQTTVHYKKTIATDFNFKILGGYSWQEFTNQGFSMNGGNFITDHFGYNNIGASQEFPAGKGSVDSYKNGHKLIAGFGRVNLRYQNTYLLSGSVRHEGSSRFGANNKWGTFYSVNGGIRLANLINIPHVQQLKLRVGYGVTGNDAPDNYLSELRFGPQGHFYYNGSYLPTYGPVSNPNPDLKWEKKKELDIGLDFSLLNDRLSGSIDAYSNKTKNLLLNFNVPVPPNLYSTEWINIGELSNKGLEAQINARVVQSKHFLWQSGLTGARHLRTKIVSLSSKKLSFGNQQIIQNLGAPGLNNTYLIRVKEGEPIGEIWGPVYEGITKDGHWKLKDIAGGGKNGDKPDGEITNADKTVIGNGQPKFTADWSNSFYYKNWNLSFTFRGIFGHDLVNTYRAFYQNPSQISSYNILQSSLDIKNLEEAPVFSSFQVENASFVQLNNASLGYTFQLSGASLRSLTLTLTGQNLFYITNYSGPDPEPRYADGDPPNPLAPGIARRNTWFNSRRFTFSVDFKF
jgi:iron complex outermembrane receptor protein